MTISTLVACEPAWQEGRLSADLLVTQPLENDYYTCGCEPAWQDGQTDDYPLTFQTYAISIL